ncbi:MAG: hypothetical protein L6Q37_15530 [Bdellovibrionaceae bacterium]|nr:hypothetical protein [Pseudobdellovibrionaceae bacterium]NUM58710.1 hypothetical protein [Pseudobdellovibrionaceae bacterium]
MYQNLSNTNKLSSGQKKILRVHEAFYTLVRRQLGVNSKPVRKFLEKILLKKISNDERDRAIKNFIAEIKLSARKYICQATAYTPLFKGSSKFYKKDTQQLIFYGQTIQEAFHKLLDAQITTGFIPCNAVGDSGNAITGICLKPLTLGENCK